MRLVPRGRKQADKVLELLSALHGAAVGAMSASDLHLQLERD